MAAANVIESKDDQKARASISNSFPVTGITCAACASSVESILGHTDGVKNASVNFASSSVLVEYDATLVT